MGSINLSQPPTNPPTRPVLIYQVLAVGSRWFLFSSSLYVQMNSCRAQTITRRGCRLPLLKFSPPPPPLPPPSSLDLETNRMSLDFSFICLWFKCNRNRNEKIQKRNVKPQIFFLDTNFEGS